MTDWADQGIRDVQDDPTGVTVHMGEMRGGIVWALEDEAVNRIRAGYQCLNCMERFVEGGMPVSWPDRCPVCGYEVKERQPADMGPEYRGEIRVGPTTSYDDELDAMKEQYDRDHHEPGSQIWLPRGLDAP